MIAAKLFRDRGYSNRAGKLVQKLPGLFRTIAFQRIGRFLLVWLAAYLVLLSSFLSVVMENNTFLEIFPRELLFPILMHAATALIIALVLNWMPWTKSLLSKLVSSTVLALLMVDYDGNLRAVAPLIRAFIPGQSTDDPLYAASVPYLLILVVVAVMAGYMAERLISKSRLKPRDVQYGTLVLVGYLFLIPAFSFLEILPTMVRQSAVVAPALPASNKQAAAVQDKPDVYYIVLDRYANANVLSEQFNYDNNQFTGFLKDSGYTVRDNALANYPYTTMSIASTLNADYVNKEIEPHKSAQTQSKALFHHLIWQSNVIMALKQSGYQYHALGSWYGATYKAPQANVDHIHSNTLTIFGKQKHLRGIEVTAFSGSPYHAFAQIPSTGWWPLTSTALSHVDIVKEQLNILHKLSTEGAAGGRFIFAHILVPHEPFAFNADGSFSAYQAADNTGMPIKQKYTQQVSFINDQMQQIVANIQKQSNGKAVVILQSDEGPYPQAMNSTFTKPQAMTDPEGSLLHDNASSAQEWDMSKWPQGWLNMKFGVLQAVHIPKASEDDLANLSSVNVFRIILNRYAGYELPYLPECHLGLADTVRTYNYFDVTQQLTGKDDPACAKLETKDVN